MSKKLLVSVLIAVMVVLCTLVFAACGKHNHQYSDGVCTVCGAIQPTEGLQYKKLDDNKSVYVSGIGTATDTDIVIAEEYEGLPVTLIGAGSFKDCTKLKSVVIPDSVTAIGVNAFYNCTELTNITIPDSVTRIGDSAFENTAYYNDNNNWKNGVLYIGKHLIKAKETLSGDYQIKKGTLTIAYFAFSDCKKLTGVTIPDEVTNIGYDAFYGCSGLKSVTIGKGVTSIGICTFNGCTGLVSITIPETVTNIGNEAFKCCTGLKSVVIPDSVVAIGDAAFIGCSGLNSVTIGKSVSSIGYRAFEECTGIKSVYYKGTEAEWNAIEIDLFNDYLKNAERYYLAK